MVKELFENNIIIYIMCGIFGVGVILKIALSLKYSSLIKASKNMGSAKNKLTQLMKLKFETFYKLKIGVNNVDIFVDKYVYHHKFCGILLSTWENICGQVLIICLLIGSVGTVLGLIYECGKTEILSVFSVGIVSSGLLIILDGFLNLSGRKELIRLNMKDYLENFLKVRLEQQLITPEMIEQYKKEYLDNEETTSEPISVDSALEEDVNHYIMVEKTEKLDKALSRKEKRAFKKEKKKIARMEAAEAKEAAKLAKKQKKEEEKAKRLQLKLDKKQNKLNKKEEKKARRLEAKELKRRKKEEARLEIERKREEKIRQQEIKKALKLEKRVAKEDKKKGKSTQQKTIAQERKENLMREIKERREQEKQLELEKNLEEEDNNLAVKEMEDGIKDTKVEEESIKEQKEEISHHRKTGLYITEDKNQNNLSKIYQHKTGSKSSHNKKRKSLNQLEDQIIEDILKEFLA